MNKLFIIAIISLTGCSTKNYALKMTVDCYGDEEGYSTLVYKDLTIDIRNGSCDAVNLEEVTE